jgi:hypothetical protein
LACILSVGILIRLILIPICSHPFDVYAWYRISNNILQNGPFALQYFPPLWYHYMMIPIAYAYDWLTGVFHTGAISMSSIPSALNFYPSFNIQYVPGLLFNSVVKFPFLISDILVTLLLYKIANELTSNKGLAEKAALLWFLNPFVIWISAGWGMWDTLPALFSLAAFYFILKKKYVLSAVCISLGVVCKLYPLLFIIPILIYIRKTSIDSQRWHNSLKFFLPFLALSISLFIPYLGMITNFFSGYFFPTSQTSALINGQVDNPLGFGLSYWALYLLNRIFNFAISNSIVSFASIFSIALFGICLIFSYWKTGKIKIKKPAYDLALIMCLPLGLLFLTQRIICEQFFMWLIPFLIILLIHGKIKNLHYWGLSVIALLYAILNCPFPFFFLPLTPWGTNDLLNMANFMLSNETLRISLLSFSGLAFSVLLIMTLRQAYTKNT